MSPITITALIIFAITYILMLAFQKIRPYVTVGSALIFVILGVVASIICIAVSSNLQGAATLVGYTTSILLAKAANLDFSDFFVHDGRIGMFWVVQAGAIVSAFIILFIKKNKEIVKNAFKEIDYYTIVLLTGLFLVIGGIKNAGVIDVIGSAIASLGSGSTFVVYTIIVWMSVRSYHRLSPFVADMEIIEYKQKATHPMLKNRVSVFI